MKKKLFALGITVLIFILIFKNIDIQAFRTAFLNINWFYLSLALGYFFIYPIVGIERWRWMINLKHHLSFSEALKIYYIGETLNVALPSKAGDLSKGYFLKKAGITSFTYGMSSVVFEKLLDLMALGFSFLIGFIFFRSETVVYPKFLLMIGSFFLLFIGVLSLDRMRWIRAVLYRMKRRKLLRKCIEITGFIRMIKRKHRSLFLLALIAVSILFWMGHLFQIFLFFKAANMDVHYSQVLFLVPIALIVAAIPVTIGGLGTRDLTLIGLFSAIAPKETILVGSLLVSLRYFIPAAIGLLFIQDAVGYIRSKQKRTA